MTVLEIDKQKKGWKEIIIYFSSCLTFHLMKNSMNGIYLFTYFDCFAYQKHNIIRIITRRNKVSSTGNKDQLM